jgi:regulator of protease activity HflC (stomatin/prohibitin superfamily)
MGRTFTKLEGQSFGLNLVDVCKYGDTEYSLESSQLYFPSTWCLSCPVFVNCQRNDSTYMCFRKVFQVRPNQIGCLFRKNRLRKKLEAGIYHFWDWGNELSLLNLSTVERSAFICNQEVLTKDNIALRFSYFLTYKLDNIDLILQSFNLADCLPYNTEAYLFSQIETQLTNITHVRIRELISSIDSEELNQKRAEIYNFKTDLMVTEAARYGIQLSSAVLRDLTFPKMIQDLFAKQLEAKIRAKSDLENARTAVATARALKNVTELMKGDDNIRFVQFLETITKIAAQGKHTFVIGDAFRDIDRLQP